LGAIGLLGLALVPTPEQVPALAKANAWAPWAAVAAILWLPATILAMALGLTSWSVAYGFTMLLHLLPIVAGYIAILVTVSPGAYEQLKQQLLSTSAAPPR
ncbi:MAG TPA: hypothetical protein VFG83_18755, partial [Kofleriaceae bacterium]|nr:hypothetical protein [Kofleriaceae bacterium]